MHPLSAEHAHSLRKRRLPWTTLCLVAVLVWAGCGTEPPSARLLAPDDTLFTTSDEEREAALAVLDTMNQDAMQRAFERLPDYAFTRRVHTEQLTPDDSVQATQERVLRFPPPDSAERPVVMHTDSSGTFQFDRLDRFAPAEGETALPTELTRHALPDDPAYLDPRSHEAFRYRLLTDTLDNHPVQVVEVHAEPGELGADQAIRHARLYVNPDSNELVGLYLVRAEAGTLFREDSRSLVRLRPAPDSGWVPARTHFHARVKVPLRAPQAFRTTSTFSGYRPVD